MICYGFFMYQKILKSAYTIYRFCQKVYFFLPVIIKVAVNKHIIPLKKIVFNCADILFKIW